MEEDRTEKLSNLFNDITGWLVLELVLAALFAWLIVKVTSKVLPVLAEFLPASLRQFTLNAVPITRVLVLAILILWAIPQVFNVTLQNFILIAGALSVAIGFALKDLSSAVIAGLIALFEKPYRSGDWVRVGDDYGEVISIGMRAFQLRTAEDDVVSIPHDRIWSKNISNSNDGTSTLMCVATFYIAREQSTKEVSRILKDVARTSPYLNFDRDIFVVARNIPLGMEYKLKAYPFEPRDQFAFITDLTERGNSALEKAEVKTVSIPAELLA